MLEVAHVRLPLDETPETLRTAAAKALGISREMIAQVDVIKRSVDARKKASIQFVVTLAITLSDPMQEAELLTKAGSGVKRHVPYEPLKIERAPDDPVAHGIHPYVIGSGPAGLFAALYLARAGLHPVLIERGPAIDERVSAVAAFERTGVLDPEANIQFGEGGAGTFSDGKLTTNTKNPYTRHVLQWFVSAGAPKDILIQAKPHMGTDKLTGVVRRLREQIIEAGGSVRFRTCLDGMACTDDGIATLTLRDTTTGERSVVETRHVILACGHSARDTFEVLRNAGIAMERKPFSVGVRIEHTQRLIDSAQYGSMADHPALGAAEYKLAVHLDNGRGVYTFCMCPGGEVVCAASEEGGVVVNGMSRFARDGQNANSALLVGVDPSDFESDDVLAGVALQREMEQAAYRFGVNGGPTYAAPAQTVGDFLSGTVGGCSQTVVPTYPRGVVWTDLRACLPEFVSTAIAEALPLLDRRLRGFADPQAVMTGVETRSSSPIRIRRNETLQALWDRESFDDEKPVTGLYPCGEGAGYAGGIMSAAVDGLRVAEALVRGLAL